MQGYCLKCREKRDIQDPQEVTLKNGRPATQGTCSVCGTKITVIGGAKAAQKVEQSDKSGDPQVGAAVKPAAKAKAEQFEAEGKDPVTAKIKAETKAKAKAARK